jgi:AraC-like DNA-binding protein/quercetin dioxygenase-like cupin family protein
MKPNNIDKVPQSKIGLPPPERLEVSGLSGDYPRGHWIAPHAHDAHQLIHAALGVMRVTSASATWVVPPGRAIWMPRGQEHAIRCHTGVAFRTVYLSQAPRGLEKRTAVCAVSPLLREILVRVAEDPLASANRHLAALLFSELAASDTLPLDLPTPEDPRLRRLTDSLLSEPSDNRDLADWAKDLGFSRRNLIRRFQAETGMTFRQWRRQARLLAALEALGAGRSVTEAAFDVGYESVSAFVAAFRESLGATPGKYFGRDAL